MRPTRLFPSSKLVCIGIYARHTKRPELHLILLALASLPAALGRADPGHLFINTMPALIISSLSLLQDSGTRKVLTVCSWVLVVWTAFVVHFVPLRVPAIGRHTSPLVEAGEREADHLRAAVPAGQTVLAPFGYVPEFHLKRTLPVTSGRFVGFAMVSHNLPALKIKELEARPADLIIVPISYHAACSPTSSLQAVGVVQYLFGQTLLPYLYRTVRTPQQLCDYIDTHYKNTPELSTEPEFLVMSRSR